MFFKCVNVVTIYTIAGGEFQLLIKAKFHYSIWSQTGPKLVADRFEAKFHYTILVADRSEAGHRTASSC